MTLVSKTLNEIAVGPLCPGALLYCELYNRHYTGSCIEVVLHILLGAISYRIKMGKGCPCNDLLSDLSQADLFSA